MKEIFISSIGQDSHRVAPEKNKPLILGGVEFHDANFCLEANSDGDVVLHAVTNAISGITGVNVLGEMADNMCKRGITNSEAYLKTALEYVDQRTKSFTCLFPSKPSAPSSHPRFVI